MNARTWWTFGLTLGLACTGLVACTGTTGTDTDTDTKTGDDDDDDDTVGDDDDDTVTDDSGSTDDSGTGGGGGGFEPYYLLPQISFSYDPDLGLVNSVTPQGENQSSFIIILGSEDWQNDGFSFDSDQYCIVLLPFLVAPAAPPDFVVDNGLYFGVEYDSADGAATTCTGDYALDPANWGTEPGYVFADPNYFPNWGAGVGPDLYPPDDPNFFTTDFAPFVFGAYVNNDFFAPPYGTEAYYATATELDGNQNLQVDAKGYRVFIPADEVPVLGTPIAHAEYNIYSYYIYY